MCINYEQLRGTYYLRYARHDHEQVYTDPATGARQQTRRDCLELLATSFTQDKPLVLQTTGLRVDPTVPYCPEFWDSYQCIVPRSDGVFSGLNFRTDLWHKHSTVAPA